MPRRRGKRSRAIMMQRLGLRGWNGSRPFEPWSKTITTKTLGEGHNPGTTAGALVTIPVNNWNDPLGSLVTLVAGTGSLTSNRHPMNHNSAIAAGYNRVQVLSWKMVITVTWIKVSDPVQDFIIAYTFKTDTGTEVTLTAGTAARIEALEFRTNPKWTLKRFNASGGTDARLPRPNTVVVSVPNVFAYCKIIADGTLALEANNQSVSHVLADTSSATNEPAIPLRCTFAIYTESGLAMDIDSIRVNVAITQRVKVMRDFIGTEDMNSGEPDVHA